MTSFALLAALLVAISLAFVVLPLVGARGGKVETTQRSNVNLAVLRDQLRELDLDLAQGIIEQGAYQQARHDLEVRVTQDVGTPGQVQASGLARAKASGLAALLCFGVIGLSLGLYNYLGNPAALDPANLKPPAVVEASEAPAAPGAPGAPGAAGEQISNQQIADMLVKIEQHLKTSPNDDKGWNIVAGTYAKMGKFEQANQAYAKLLAIKPNDATVLTDAADSLAMGQGRSLQGEPEKLLLRALQVEPKNVKGLILLGSARFERKDYAGAVAAWQQLQAVVPPDSQLGQQLAQNVQEAQRRAQGADAAQPAASVASTAASTAVSAAASAAASAKSASPASSPLLSGTVQIDANLVKDVAPGDSVFIFARAPEGGPKFPLVVLRKQVQDLPLQFSFDDSNSMIPNTRLSDFKQVVLTARISKSGNAMPAAGDWEGSAGTVNLGATAIRIVINQKRP
jgi:cytochrome c-type biogenesis protein CcmH